MINSDSHNLWLGLAEDIDLELRKIGLNCDIWVNDLGYMEISNPETDRVVVVWWENDRVWYSYGINEDKEAVGKLEQFADSVNPALAGNLVISFRDLLYAKESRKVDEASSLDTLEQYIKAFRKQLPKFGVELTTSTPTFLVFSSIDNPEDEVKLPLKVQSSGLIKMDMTPIGGSNAADMRLGGGSTGHSFGWNLVEDIKYLGRALRSYFKENKEESYYRTDDSRTTDVWKEIVNKIKKDARSRKLVIADSKLNSLTLADRKDPDKKVELSVDLVNTGSGECVVKLGKKTWKMGDTQIRDRSMKGGTKTPDMDAQVENILDMVEFTISEIGKKDTNEAVDMNRPLWEGWTPMDYAKDNEMIMDMIMSGRSNTYRNDRIPKNKAELKKAIMDNCTPNVPKLQRAVVDYFCKRYGIK